MQIDKRKGERRSGEERRKLHETRRFTENRSGLDRRNHTTDRRVYSAMKYTNRGVY